MSEVKNIRVSSIDPESTTNVRKTEVEGNVENVKASIQEHGYWSDQPIIVRPHPNPESQFQYEYVTGQCRFKACLELGLEEIPAFVIELDDDQAIQRSWLENEVRGELTYSDRAYWVDKVCKKYSGRGHTLKEALELAGKYLGVKLQTIMNYYSLVVLPEDIMQMVDRGALTEAIAVQIARNTFNASRFEQSQEAMRERADWVIGLDRDKRKYVAEALKELGHKATIFDLNNYVEEKISQVRLTVQYTIPKELHEDFLKWGRERGLKEESAIIAHMITEVLKKG